VGRQKEETRCFSHTDHIDRIHCWQRFVFLIFWKCGPCWNTHLWFMIKWYILQPKLLLLLNLFISLELFAVCPVLPILLSSLVILKNWFQKKKKNWFQSGNGFVFCFILGLCTYYTLHMYYCYLHKRLDSVKRKWHLLVKYFSKQNKTKQNPELVYI